MSIVFTNIAIIGVGLIGGSLGMAIKRQGLATKVIGIDLNATSLQLAKEMQVIDQGSANLEALRDADLVVLAAPISINLKLLTEIEPYLKPGTIVTDVGSTKGDIVTFAKQLRSDCHFIGGHPMAGSEVGGVKGADPYLFENAIYVLTPTDTSNPQALVKLKQLVVGIGGLLIELEPEEHDLIVATISHLPHLVASTLVNTAAKINEKHVNTLMLAAGGFRDTTRIASGNPDLWRDICFSNRDKLLVALSEFKHVLHQFERQLADGNGAFRQGLAAAKLVRDQVPAKLKGYWPFLEEIILTIPDQVGMIGKVAAILAEHKINIDDIEILRVREGEGGSLRVGFARKGAGKRAVEVLSSHGFLAREK